MKNSDMPAMPIDMEGAKLLEEGYFYAGWGLTKREYFAGLAMQGLLSGSSENETLYEFVSSAAVAQADALLKALEASA